jgi:hypothetical protein
MTDTGATAPDVATGLYRKKPVTVRVSVPWTGANLAEFQALTGPANFYAVEADDRRDDPDITAEVWDKLHSTWVGVKDGQSIIRGVKGEFYPIDADVLAETYEPADAIPLPAGEYREQLERQLAEAGRELIRLASAERDAREQLAACRQNNAAIAVQLDQYRNERVDAREACDRLRQEALKRYGMVPSWVKSALEADGA